MKTTAIDYETKTPQEVDLCVIQDVPGYPEYSVLAVFDAITGFPVYWDTTSDSWSIVTDDDWGLDDSEIITDVYGEDENEWKESADSKLEQFGVKLGSYVDKFSFTIDGWNYDGYMLETID